MRRVLTLGAALTIGIAALTAQSAQVPAFQVDPFWPKPLPNHWLLGSITGVAVDSQNHVWIVHRGTPSMTARTEIGLATDPPTAETCCKVAPLVMRFDPSGKPVSFWGGPGEGYDWPLSSFVPNVLSKFDLPEVYEQLKSKQLRQIDPRGAM